MRDSMVSLGVTPPYRVEQNDTHVFVEAQCSESPTTVSPEVACDATIFALRCPPYYLPLHFPAPLTLKPHVHRMGTLVRVDLQKETPGLEFMGLDHLQPTMFSDGAAAKRLAFSAQEGTDLEVQAILDEVLQRENLSTVEDNDDKEQKGPKEESLLDMSDALREERARAAEASEDAQFDEQSYLDAYVDQDGEVAVLLEMEFTVEGGSSHSIGPPDSQPASPLIMIDILYAYYLALRHSCGPPLSSPWLVTTLSRTLSTDVAPPGTDATMTGALRGGFRRGLAFPLHRSWLLCHKAAGDLTRALRTAGEAVGALHRVMSCLADGSKQMPEGPEEGKRWLALSSMVLQPLIAWASVQSDAFFDQLATEVSQASANLTKDVVGPTWDLELLERMALDVMQEERGEIEARIMELCLDLCPPSDLAPEDFDAFAAPLQPARQSELALWVQGAPRKLRALLREFALYTLRSRQQQECSTDFKLVAAVAVACSRFSSSSHPWSCDDSHHAAERFLSQRFARLTESSIRWILSEHIRPLFISVADPGSVDERGRARHQRAHLSETTVGKGHEEGTPLWKGQVGRPLPGREGLYSIGAGVHLTLRLCLDAIEKQSCGSDSRPERGNGSNLWESVWHLILPPVMRIVEDSDPRWRSRGAELLVRGFLTSTKATEMLQRTNLVPHLKSVLFDDLTYLSSSHGVQLLDLALLGLRSLPDLTAEDRMRIVEEGVLRVWTFAPRSLDEPPDVVGPHVKGRRREPDLLTVTFSQLAVLSCELGTLAARYIDVCLEFICAQVGGIYDRVVTLSAPASKDGAAACTRRLGLWMRTRKGVEAMDALVRACLSQSAHKMAALLTLPPNLVSWSGRVLSALVKARLAVSDAISLSGYEEELDLVTATAAASEARERRLLTQSIAKAWMKTWSDDVIGAARKGNDATKAEETIRALEATVQEGLDVRKLADFFGPSNGEGR